MKTTQGAHTSDAVNIYFLFTVQTNDQKSRVLPAAAGTHDTKRLRFTTATASAAMQLMKTQRAFKLENMHTRVYESTRDMKLSAYKRELLHYRVCVCVCRR